MKKATYIWQNGSIVPWDKAQVHVLTHALHYGTAVFEGIRAYATDQGPAIFRAEEHYQRLLDSAKLLLIDNPYTVTEWIEATKDLIQKNNLESCYIRPILFYGYGEMGLNPENNPIESTIADWEWVTYLGEEGLEKGIKCKMSSWKRPDSQIAPPLAKTAAHYLNSGFAKREALRCGYDEAILLNMNGFVAEGPGENLFAIKDNTIMTPPCSDSALKGITAQTIMDIAKNEGYNVEIRSMIRDELFLADELFFTGTAAEITPIREIDGITIGNGKRGPLTEKLQSTYFDIVKGKLSNYHHWLTFV